MGFTEDTVRVTRDDIVLSMPDYFDENSVAWMPLTPYPAILVMYDFRDPFMTSLLQIDVSKQGCEAMASNIVVNDWLLLSIGSTGRIRPATLVHELVHIRSYLFDYMGIYPDCENDEPEAYLMGHMFRGCTEMVNLMDKRCRIKEGLSRIR